MRRSTRSWWVIGGTGARRGSSYGRPQKAVPTKPTTKAKRSGRALPKIHFFETETLEKTGNRGASVAVSRFQNISLHRGFLKLALGFLANFAFQIRIGG